MHFRYGYHKKCSVYPREECHDIPIKHPVKVPLGKCHQLLILKPSLYVISAIFSEECHDVPKTYCRKVPFQVPHERCKPVPDKQCIEVTSTSTSLLRYFNSFFPFAGSLSGSEENTARGDFFFIYFLVSTKVFPEQ